MNRIILWTLLMALTVGASSQRYFEAKVNDQDEYVVHIQVEKGNTLFGLAQSVGISPDVVLSSNQKATPILSIGERLVLPISSAAIHDNPRTLAYPTPLYYHVRKGDNLYRITKRCDRSTQDILTINNRSSEGLNINERLLLGWIDWPFGGLGNIVTNAQIQITSITKNVSIDPIASMALLNHYPAPALSTGVPTIKKTVKEKGIAYWEKADYPSKELIVMHPHAKINSKVSLYNPMLRRSVEAKVVSELPKESYPEEISVVISPSVASALGALDRRFQVEITYVE